jgi:predicted DNA-binding protein
VIYFVCGGDNVISKDNTRTILSIPKALKEQLEQLAEKDGRSLNNYITMILKAHIEKPAKE